MSAAGSGSRVHALRRVPATMVAGVGAALALVTFLAGLMSWWQLAVGGLALLHLVTLVAVLRPRPSDATAAKSLTTALKIEKSLAGHSAKVVELEQRVDALSTRSLAGIERTRVEVLDALSASEDRRA